MNGTEKALECLEKVEELQYIDHYVSCDELFEPIKQALEKLQKIEKIIATMKGTFLSDYQCKLFLAEICRVIANDEKDKSE